jgi:hypothetical protein
MLEMKGASDRLDREHKDRAWLAYHSAYLPDAKKRPTLAQLIGGKPKSRIMPWQDQLAAWANYASYRKGIK